jgi:hypothetical protein
MNFRRSDFDVTNRINTTDPVCVKLEVVRIFRTLYSRSQSPSLESTFNDVSRIYRGNYPGFAKCDTQYHDLQHILEVTLAMARLLDGYERSRGDARAIGERLFQLGVVCALYHDVGYIPRVNDKKHHNGAEYTTIHVSRGGRFLRDYLPTIGMEEYAEVAASILHFTGYERAVKTIRVPDPIYKLVGSLLGSADIIAQMSDRCYLEKCRDRLYPELWPAASRGARQGGEVVCSSRPMISFASQSFYKITCASTRTWAAPTSSRAHFGGTNPYTDAVRQNIRFSRKHPLTTR